MLNQLKSQFGEILSREELKNIVGGTVVPAKCSIECPEGPPAECEGTNCKAKDGYGCWTEEEGWKLCEIVINPPVD